jgi:hypothetical protein
MTDHKRNDSFFGMSQHMPRQRPPAAPDAATAQRAAAGPAGEALATLSAALNEAPVVQRLATMAPNRTGMSDTLKAGVEAMSGMSLDHVRVHRNSPKPAQLNAHAYAQGSDIHLAPGQERHLPHEAWHVVQQAQGRVRPTMQMHASVPINDDRGLEQEADVMGARALQRHIAADLVAKPAAGNGRSVRQRAGRSSAPVAQLLSVNVPRKQKLIKDTGKGALSGTEFGWDSKFDVEIVGNTVQVTIRIRSDIPDELFASVWAPKVSEKWSDRFMIKAGDKNYPIFVNLVKVDAGEHYAVTAVHSKSALKSGGRAHFGTSDMTNWGAHDTTNVAHEVGHMLGNVDEYGVVEVNGAIRDYEKAPSSTIMAVSAENPIAEHYYLIKWAADQELKLRPDQTSVVPNIAARIGAAPMHAPDLSSIGSQAAKLKKVEPKSVSMSSVPSSAVPDYRAMLRPTPKASIPVSVESNSNAPMDPMTRAGQVPPSHAVIPPTSSPPGIKAVSHSPGAMSAPKPIVPPHRPLPKPGAAIDSAPKITTSPAPVAHAVPVSVSSTPKAKSPIASGASGSAKVEPKKAPAKDDYTLGREAILRNLRAAQAKLAEHGDSWVVRTLVGYIETNFAQYDAEYRKNGETSTTRWCVSSSAQFVRDIDTAIAEEAAQEH